MNFSPRRILLVYHNPDPPEKTRVTILQHLRALEYCEIEHDIVYYNAYEASSYKNMDNKPGSIPSKLRNVSFDVAILHYTFLSQCTSGLFFYKWRRKFEWIRDLNCLKIAIPQDEGNFPELLDEWLFDLGVSVIFSVHYSKEGPLYPIMRDRATIYSCLPGYIDEDVAERLRETLLPITERPKDIVYRARRLPYRYGKAGRIKYLVADVVAPQARRFGFNVDISTRYEDAIFGDEWFHFLASSKVVIGTPGGWSAIDWRGELRAKITGMIKENPWLDFEQVDRQMPKGWDEYEFLTMTPRHFEAVITKTCQLLVENSYGGVLQADKHYIPLKQDFSNLDDALAKLSDHKYMQGIVERAYEEIYLSGKYTYRRFAKKIEEVFVKHIQGDHTLMKSVMDDKTTAEAIAVFERQIIAERHHNALLHAMLPEIATQMADMAIRAVWREMKRRLKRILLVVAGVGLGFIVILVLFLLF